MPSIDVFIARSGARLRYDADADIVVMTFQPKPANRLYTLETVDDVQAHFDGVLAFLERCGRHDYLVINYENFDVNPDVNRHYLACLRLVEPYSRKILRCGGNILQRATVRSNALNLRTRANLFDSFEEALKELSRTAVCEFKAAEKR